MRLTKKGGGVQRAKEGWQGNGGKQEERGIRSFS